ncbi:tetratricopeptide repeat protein [Candidatus Harpocratesius sp.]
MSITKKQSKTPEEQELEDFFKKSLFKEGLARCLEMKDNPFVSEKTKLKIGIFQLRFMEKLEKFEEGIKHADLLLKSEAIRLSSILKVEVLTELTKIYFSKSDLNLVIKTIQQAEELLYHDKSLSNEELEQKMADLVLLRGGYEWHQGELENALFFFKFNLELRKKYGNHLDLANALNNVGVIYNAIGELPKALKYLKDALNEYEKIKNMRGISKTGHNIGAILIQMGELDESLQYMQKSLSIDIQDNYRDGIRVALQNIGEVYWHKHDYEQALDNLSNCLALLEETQQFFEITEVCIPLIAVHLEMNNKIAAFQCLTRIIQIHSKDPNKIIEQRLWLGKGLYFKFLNTFESIKKAEFYFNQIIYDEVRYFDITAMAWVNLTELYILKMEKDYSFELLKPLNEILQKMIQFARQNHSYSMVGDSLLIKAKVMFLQGNIENSHILLQKALRIAQNHGLHRLEVKILNELDLFLEKSDFWESTPFISKINLSKSMKKSYINALKNEIREIFSPETNKNKKINKKIDKETSDEETKIEKSSLISTLTKSSNKIIPECFIIINKHGRILINTPFQPKWKEESLFFSVFQINLMALLQDFATKGISMNRYEDVKILFFHLSKLNSIGIFIYQGSVLIALNKIKLLKKRIEENFSQFLEFQDIESQQKDYVNMLQQDIFNFMVGLCS